MISVVLGSDAAAKRDAVATLIATAGDAEILHFDALDFDREKFLNAVAGGDMFGGAFVAVLRDVFESDHSEFVSELAEQMADSRTAFIVVEEKLLKAETELLKPLAKSWKSFDAPKAKEYRFNIFSVSDAFGARDKKSTWVLFQKALGEHIAPEEVLNIIIWQIKNILLVKDGESAKASGLSPFVYDKSRRYAENFTREELVAASRGAVSLFHKGHLGLDLGPNLELFLLKTL